MRFRGKPHYVDPRQGDKRVDRSMALHHLSHRPQTTQYGFLSISNNAMQLSVRLVSRVLKPIDQSFKVNSFTKMR